MPLATQAPKTIHSNRSNGALSDVQMRPNKNQINKSGPKLVVEQLAKMFIGVLGDLK